MERKIFDSREMKEITAAGKIAKFYGFEPLSAPEVTRQDFDVTKEFDPSYHPAEKAALLRMYFDERMMAHSQPCMFYCERPFHGMKEKKRPMRLEASLISMGSGKSVCECLSIQATMSLLHDLGYKDLEVVINSVGDKDSMNEFSRRLTMYVRKNFNSFPADLRQELKKDPFVIVKQARPEWAEAQAACPKPIDFLSEPSRLHFKEVLEFLEIMDIPYSIDHYSLGDIAMANETIFKIKSEDEVLAHGFRFNRLAKKIGCKKDLSCTCLNISAKLKKDLKRVKLKATKPHFYLVQFGPEAKLRSFLILHELHKAGANVIHAIAKDKLSSQMLVAEASEASYILLIGQKEALENSVAIRHTVTRSQQIVRISDLALHAKGLI